MPSPNCQWPIPACNRARTVRPFNVRWRTKREIGHESTQPIDHHAKPMYSCSRSSRKAGQIITYAPIAQLDRAPVYGTGGQGFKSLWAHHNEKPREIVAFLFPESMAADSGPRHSSSASFSRSVVSTKAPSARSQPLLPGAFQNEWCRCRSFLPQVGTRHWSARGPAWAEPNATVRPEPARREQGCEVILRTTTLHLAAKEKRGVLERSPIVTGARRLA